MSYPRTSRQAQFIQLADELAAPIAARAEAIAAANTFPTENFRDLHAAGYLALTIPTTFGGQGASVLEYALAQERLARACGSTGLAASMHLSLLGRITEVGLWPESIFSAICQDVVANGALINAVNSEPDLGSPSRGALPSTTAERTPNGWRINGRKRWASLAPALSYIYSLATVTDGDKPPHRGNFLIPAQAPGVRIEETWDNLGMRGTASHDIIFDNVEIPFEHHLPADAGGNPNEISVWHLGPSAAVYLGIAQAARDEAVEFAQSRKPNGLATSIAELPAIQHKIAEIELLLLQTRTLLYTTLEQWLEEPGRRGELGWQLVAAKYTVTTTALRVTDLALRVAGSAGLSYRSPLQRYFRDARTALGHPPMEDAVLTLIGKTALGLIPTAAPVAANGAAREAVPA
ncbi:MAG: acyl-CoA/acyl-ACP dehydrogenase [Thermomicrobiales bacterium]|nr:acyl-CoA/acyl-ACP dehydrogenase [Thermomicrobiales bacterium]